MMLAFLLKSLIVNEDTGGCVTSSINEQISDSYQCDNWLKFRLSPVAGLVFVFVFARVCVRFGLIGQLPGLIKKIKIQLPGGTWRCSQKFLFQCFQFVWRLSQRATPNSEKNKEESSSESKKLSFLSRVGLWGVRNNEKLIGEDFSPPGMAQLPKNIQKNHFLVGN